MPATRFRGNGRLRHTLTLAEFEQTRSHLNKLIARKAERWNAHGWAVVGSKRSLQMEIAVPVTLVEPPHPVRPIRLSRAIGGVIKPVVRSSLAEDLALPVSAPATIRAFDDLPGAITEPLAPGSRIIVRSSESLRAGIACFVHADNDLYLVTCGHVFDPGAFATRVVTRGRVVAMLSHNFLEETPQLDAAYCRVLPAGEALLAASHSASTWYGDVLPPAQGQNESAVFWPTNEAAGGAVATTIDSFAASASHLHNELWSDLELRDMVRTERITMPGDSGSLLAVANHYYALCTGAPGFSYFTPLFDVIERMRRNFSKVEIWRPLGE